MVTDEKIIKTANQCLFLPTAKHSRDLTCTQNKKNYICEKGIDQAQYFSLYKAEEQVYLATTKKIRAVAEDGKSKEVKLLGCLAC